MSPTPDITFLPNFVTDQQSLFDRLVAEVQWDERLRARKTASFGVSYDYSGMSYPQVEMPAILAELCDRIQQAPGLLFRPNNCLLNYYPDGASSMGFHSDSSEELAEGTGVAIISLGGLRDMLFRLKADRAHELSYQLTPGSLLYMSKELQSLWLHAIPKAESAGPRISVTFRHIIKDA
jgi:alkylated DNA repair dioxygenase AlkB